MPLLILGLSMYLAAALHRCLQTCAPSSLLVARVRRARASLRTGTALLALAAALILGAFVLSEWAANGGPGWLHLFVLIAVWDSLKIAILALSVVVRCAAGTLRRITAPGRPTVHEV